MLIRAERRAGDQPSWRRTAWNRLTCRRLKRSIAVSARNCPCPSRWRFWNVWPRPSRLPCWDSPRLFGTMQRASAFTMREAYPGRLTISLTHLVPIGIARTFPEGPPTAPALREHGIAFGRCTQGPEERGDARTHCPLQARPDSSVRGDFEQPIYPTTPNRAASMARLSRPVEGLGHQ